MWVLTLVPPLSGARFEVPSYLSAMTMMLELFRRTIWGFLRLENEHRSAMLLVLEGWACPAASQYWSSTPICGQEKGV